MGNEINELENELGLTPEKQSDSPSGTPGETEAAKADDSGNAAPRADAAPKAEDDPEHELELPGEDGKPTKQKVKLSDLKKGYLRESDYTKKTQELAQMRQHYKDIESFVNAINGHDGLRKLIHGIVVKSGLDEGKVNDEVVNKFLAGLEEKQEIVDQQQDDIEKLLQELDPDSPQYKALKRQYEQNKALQKKLDAIEQKMTGFEKLQKTSTEQAEKQALDKATAEASEVLATTLKELADKSKGGYEFIHEDEQKDWAAIVQGILSQIKWPENTTLATFKELVKTAGKKAYEVIGKKREAYQAHFLKSAPKAPEKPAKKDGLENVNTDDLNDDEKDLMSEILKT